MPLFLKASGVQRTGTPWWKVNGVWVRPVKVFFKTGGAYQEVWPLTPEAPPPPPPPVNPPPEPNPPPNAASSAQLNAGVYRNDRIEFDFSWSAPASGPTPTYYRVSGMIAGVPFATTVNHPTVALTLTNNGAGYQALAGQQVVWSVQAFNAIGGGGTTPGITRTIGQLPAPPAPSVTSVNWLAAPNQPDINWSFTNDNRTTSFILRVFIHDTNQTFDYPLPKSVALPRRVLPWDAQNANGLTFTTSVAAVGPGGTTWSTGVQRKLPSSPRFTSCRFTSGELRVAWTGGTAGETLNFYRYPNGVPFLGAGTAIPVSNGAHTVAGSGGFARDGIYHAMFAEPQNAYGKGALVFCGQPRKIALPYYVRPVGYNTNVSGQWSGGLNYLQGATGFGQAYGYLFFGNKFRDELNDAYLGYTLGITGASISFLRVAGYGPAWPVSPRLWLHTAFSEASANNGAWGGGENMDLVGPGGGTRPFFPAHWVRHVIQQDNGWRGFGVALGDQAQFAGTNSEEGPGIPWGTVAIYHDG